MYNYTVNLIKNETTYDELGNPINMGTKQKVLCHLAEVGFNEFYNAQVADLKPEIKFIIKRFEYSGEKKIEFEGKIYQVIRTYYEASQGQTHRKNALKFDEIELTCERVVGDG